MSLSGPDWVKLNRLLDEALDLEPARRSQWMDSLPAEYEALRETLKDLLLRNAGPETADVLRHAPSFQVAQAQPVASGDVLGPYRLVREIGAGGMATVWLAERADGTLQRKVALKLPRISWLDRDFADRLNRERDILASLEHPGIARLYDAGVDSDGRPFLALEYVDGIPLDRYVTERALSMSQRLQLFLQVAKAVAYAHARLIVHRDLKPTNILVKDDTVHLLDFGIAQLMAIDATGNQALPGPRALTPRYAAPEQFEGQQATVATDVYSLGVILYELLAGCSPYPCKRDSASGEMLCLAPVPLEDILDQHTARAVRGDLAAIVMKALALDPQARYETVSEFAEDVERQQRNLPIRALPNTKRYRCEKFVKRHSIAVALSAALLVTVVVGAGAAVWQAERAIRQRDHALRLFQEAETFNELWTMVLTEGVGFEQSVSVRQLLERGERVAERAFAHAPSQYSVAMDSLAAMYMSYGMDARAHLLTGKGLERIESFDANSHRAASLQCSYAVAVAALGRVAEADATIERTIARISGEPDLEQYCLLCRFYVASSNNDAINALSYIQRAYDLSLQFPTQSQSKSAVLLAELAAAYALNGRDELAEQYYETAAKQLRDTGRADGRVAYKVYSGLSSVSTNTGNPALALQRIDQAMQIGSQLAPGGEPALSLLGKRANALTLLGRYEEALLDFERMGVRASGGWSMDTYVYALAGIADINLTRGNLPDARVALDRIDNGAIDKIPPGSASALRFLMTKGRVLTAEGHFDAAHAALTDVIERFETSSVLVAGRAKAYIARAELLLRMSRLDAALVDAQRAVDIAASARGQTPFSNMLGLAELVRAEALLQKDDRPAAAESLRTALTNLRNTLGANHPDTRRAEQMLNALPMT